MLLQPVQNVSVCQRKWQNCQFSQGGSHILTWRISRILGKGSHFVSGRGSHLPLKMDMVLPGWMAFHSPFKPYHAMALWTASYSSKVNDHKKLIQWEKRCHSNIKTKNKKLNLLWCRSNIYVCWKQFNFSLAENVAYNSGVRPQAFLKSFNAQKSKQVA